MRAAVLTELNAPLVLADLTLPSDLAVGQVLVKVAFSGICGSQLGEIGGAKGEDKYLPHLLGHEASGTVAAVGPGITHVQRGDTVVMHWRQSRGIEAATPQYTWGSQRVNAGRITTFNEYAIVSENRLTAISSRADLRVAALFGCAVTTGFGIIENDAKVRVGESIVVFGAGGIGLNVVQAAAMAGAHPIIAIDRFDNRVKLARAMGATHVVNTRHADPELAIRDAAGKGGPDVFVENTGQPSVIELGYRITQPAGRIILVGVPAHGKRITIYSLPLHFGKRLSGSHGGQAVPERDIPRLLALYETGRLQLRPMLTDCYPLERINEALDDMRSGKVAGRCLIRMPGAA